MEQPYIALGVQGINGSCFTANMLLDGHRPESLDGTGKLVCRFKSLPLFPQSYAVKMSVRTRNGNDLIVNLPGSGLFQRSRRSCGIWLQGGIFVASFPLYFGGGAL